MGLDVEVGWTYGMVVCVKFVFLRVLYLDYSGSSVACCSKDFTDARSTC